MTAERGTRVIRLVGVGGDASRLGMLLERVTGLPAAVVGNLASLGVLLGIGPDLDIDLAAVWIADPEAAADDLQALARLRPGCGLLLVVTDARRVGLAELTCQEWRRRGELRAIAVAAPEDASLERGLARVAALQGWPLASPQRFPADGQHRMVPTSADQAPAPRGGVARSPRLLAVFSPKGGAGKTTLAVNLAALASAGRPGACALADLDLETPDVATLLDLPPQPDLVDLLPVLAGGAQGEWGLLRARNRGEFDVLPGPARPDLAQLVDAAQLRLALERLRERYAVTLVDTSGRLSDDATFLAMEAADVTLLIVTPEPPALRRARQAVDLMSRLGWNPEQRLRVVVNGVDRGEPLPLRRIEGYLGLPVAACVPGDRDAFAEAAAQGVPLVVSHPEHPVANALQGLLRALGLAAAGPAGLAPGSRGRPPWARWLAGMGRR